MEEKSKPEELKGKPEKCLSAGGGPAGSDQEVPRRCERALVRKVGIKIIEGIIADTKGVS